jgi:hypothetical protein
MDSITLGILLGESYDNWHPYACGLFYLAYGPPIANLLPAPSYAQQPSDEGMGLHVRYCLIPSHSGRQWLFSKGCEGPGLRYLLEC